MPNEQAIEKSTQETLKADIVKLEAIQAAQGLAESCGLDDAAYKIMTTALTVGHMELINRKSLQAINARRQDEIKQMDVAWDKASKEDLVVRLQLVAEHHRNYYHKACVVEGQLRELRSDDDPVPTATITKLHALMDELTDDMAPEQKETPPSPSAT